MNRYGRWLVLGVVTAGLCLLPAACAWSAAGRDACAMLKRADVEAAFAPRKFDSGKLDYTVKRASTQAEVSSCTYTSHGTKAQDMITVTLELRRAQTDAVGISAKAARADAVQRKATPVDVAGLGKGAYWVSRGSIAFPVFELHVFRGKREWLVFSSETRTLNKSAVLAGLTQLARTTIARN